MDTRTERRSAALTPPGLPADGPVDTERWLASIEPWRPLLRRREGRIALTRFNPLLFGLVYLLHHLRDGVTGATTVSEFHVDLAKVGLSWAARPGLMRHRNLIVGPRDAGKSTWNFLINPLWAAAHQHLRFIAAFADSGGQAEQHLVNLRSELDRNELIRHDFPDLVRPMTRRPEDRSQVADSRHEIRQASGFTMIARGMTAASLGMKVGEVRPQLLLMDDFEPSEEVYSPLQAEKRLNTIQHTVLALNNAAKVAMSGFVTMPGSIVHQAVQSVTSEQKAAWVADEQIRVRYWPAIIDNGDGTERSLWPEKWPLAWMETLRHTATFAQNFMNNPRAAIGTYWSGEELIYGHPRVGCPQCEETGRTGVVIPEAAHEPEWGNTLLTIDPAVKAGKNPGQRRQPDRTGLAIVSRDVRNTKGRVYVRHAVGIRVGGKLREPVMSLLEQFPETRVVYVEVNQGGEFVTEALAGLPVKVVEVEQTVSKDVRMAWALRHYEAARVIHAKRLPQLEQEQLAYPKGMNDDVVDAVTTGVLYFLGKPSLPTPPAQTGPIITPYAR